MLEIGSTLPPIALEDTAGALVDFTDYRARSNVLLYFMRSTGCPVCNGHVRDLVKSEPSFAAGRVQVLIAVPEGRAEALTWKNKRALPYPVVTGRTGSPHEAVGLTRRVFGSLQQSGSILVDVDGIVRHAHGATLPTGSYDKKGIRDAIDALLPAQ